MNLYKLQGLLKKEKKQQLIYVVAPDEQNAVERASQFASDVTYVSHTKLARSWDAFFCN